jgi:hypothetical protein
MSAISSSISFLTAAYALRSQQKTAQSTPSLTQSIEDSLQLSQTAIEAIASGKVQNQ